MRRTYVAAIAAGIALLLAGLGLAVRLTSSVDRYRADVERVLTNRLGRQVTLGRIRPSLFPIGVRIDGLSIADDPALETTRPLARAEAVRLALHPLALLRGRFGDRFAASGTLRFDRVHVRGLDLGYPIAVHFNVTSDASVVSIRSATIYLDRTPLTIAGTLDFRSEPGALDLRVTTSDASLAEAARLASGFGVAFGSGMNAQGRLSADLRAHGPMSAPAFDGFVRLRRVSVSGPGLPQPVETAAVDLSLTPDDIRSNDFTVTTNRTSLAVALLVAHYTRPAPVIDVRIRASDVNIADVLDIAHAWGVQAADGVSGSGRITVDVQASGPTAAPALHGSGSLNEATLKSAVMTQPVRIRHADLTFSGDAAAVDNVRATIGRTNVEGRLGARTFASPKIDFDLSADNVDVEEELRIFGGNGMALRRATGAGLLRAGSIAYGQFVARAFKANIVLDRGVIRLNPLTAALFDGGASGSLVVDTRRTPAAIVLVGTLQRVDANRFAAAVTGMRDTIEGQATANVRVSFLAGAGNMPRTLNGTVSMNIPNGRIAHMDVLHEVGTFAQFAAGHAPVRGATSVAAFSGTFQITDGIAYTNSLTGAIEGGRIGAAGSVNLVNHALHLRMNVVLSRSFSRAVGGTGVGGFMETVLADRQGQLVIPVLVTGTIEQPTVAPDLERLAEMKVTGLAAGLLGAPGAQPQGTTGDTTFDAILGAMIGQRQPPPPAAKGKPNHPKDPLEEALQKLFGGTAKKKKPPSKK